MITREIRSDDADRVTQLYLDACRRLSERDPEWGVPEWRPINRWLLNTVETDDAVCLVSDMDGVVGLLLASVTRHPAMPGVVGTLEELMVEPRPDEVAVKQELVDAGIAWARERGANRIQTIVGLRAPWTEEELSFWTANGFEHDQTLVTRYSLEESDCS